jgi:YggT family protein
MPNPFNNAGLFLIQAIFDLYIFVVMLRIVMQWVHADFANPLFQVVAKLTNHPLKPIRRIIPVVAGIDVAAIVLLLILEVIKWYLLIWLQANSIPAFSGLIILAFAELLGQLLNIFFYAILIMAILSWLNPLAHGPLMEVLYRITEPLMRPIRRIIPPIAGLDLSPIPVLIGLKLLSIVVVQPLIQIGAELALG